MSDLSQFMMDCHHTLMNDKDRVVEEARNYLLKDRKLLENNLKCHIIGYCKSDSKIPDSVRYFGTLHKPKKERWDISRNIRGRIIVPICSEFGEVVAFATRVPTTEPGNPWWNLPSPFKKGNCLYLLNKARKAIYDKNKVYVVEGYADALILYQHGIENVVAVMGTAYTLRKIGLTARYCNNVCLCFDSDTNGAGTKAKFLSIALLQKYNFCNSISVIDSLPLKEDPASFVANEGVEKFLKMERELDELEIQKICINVASGNNSKLLYAK